MDGSRLASKDISGAAVYTQYEDTGVVFLLEEKATLFKTEVE